MYKSLSVGEARGSFAQTLKRASEGESLLILRRNRPIAAVISPSEAVRFFRFRADELNALVERDPAQQTNGTDDALVASQEDAAQQEAEGVTGEAQAVADQPEGESANPTPEEASLPEDFKADLERYVWECRAVGHPVESVISEVFRVSSPCGVTRDAAERFVDRIYAEEG